MWISFCLQYVFNSSLLTSFPSAFNFEGFFGFLGFFSHRTSLILVEHFRTLPWFSWVFSVGKADLRSLCFKLLWGLLAAKKHRKLLKSWLEKIQVKRGLWPPLGCSFEHTDSAQASTWKALQKVRPSNIAWYNFLDWRKHFTCKNPLQEGGWGNSRKKTTGNQIS